MTVLPLDHSHPEVLRNPYPVYKYYRENDPIHFVPSQQAGIADRYIFTRYKDVLTLLRHKNLVRQIRASQWDEKSRDVPTEHLAYARTLREWALFTDPPKHAALRKPLNRTMNAATTPDLRGWIAVQAEEYAAKLPQGQNVDIIHDYGGLLTTKVAADLLGLDGLVEIPRLQVALTSLLPVLANRYDPARMALVNLEIEFLEGILRQALDKPPQNLEAARLLTGIAADSGLQNHQIIPTAMLLLFAARDNVRNLIGSTVMMLLSVPERWAQVRDRPELLPKVIEEVLRLESPVQFVSRHAGDDLEISGVLIRKGQGVTIGMASANRDPEYFENPDEYNLDRETDPIASFGFGIHACPGEKLGRMMIEEGVLALIKFWENPQLVTPMDELPWQKSMVFRGLGSLLVSPQ